MKFVAVTSCPTGIAHCQMAAETLEWTAEQLGHEISVEIQSAVGVRNELATAAIEAADAVIIAADPYVDRDRFEGKPLVSAPVDAGLTAAERLIEASIELVEAGRTGEVELDFGEEETADAAGSPGGGTDELAVDGGSALPVNATEAEPTPQRGGSASPTRFFSRLKRLFS